MSRGKEGSKRTEQQKDAWVSVLLAALTVGLLLGSLLFLHLTGNLPPAR